MERKRLRDREVEYVGQIQREKERVDALLHVIMPHEVVDELQATGSVRPRRYEPVAVLFADIVGFTPYCDAHPPEEIVQGLRAMVERFEQAAMENGVQKIKTIGDAFMAAAGLFRATENAVLDCVRCGMALVTAAAEVAPQWPIRVGIHAGSVIGGVVGARQYLFDIWGDTVNTAARVEHSGLPRCASRRVPAPGHESPTAAEEHREVRSISRAKARWNWCSLRISSNHLAV